MRLRKGTACSIGVAVALTIGLATQAAAQVTSDQRIRIVKEVPGDVVVRVDTVLMRDTLRITRVDTVTRTVTFFDTVSVETMPGFLTRRDGFYLGFAGGPAAVGFFGQNSLQTGNSNGWTAQGQIGWERSDMPLGLRIDAGYIGLGETPAHAFMGAQPDMYQAGANAKLHLPNLARRAFPWFQPYVTAGVNALYYKGLRVEAEPGTAGTGPNNVIYSGDSYETRFGWNAGLGLNMAWGRTQLFLEGRGISFTPPNAAHTARVFPVTLGVNWFSF
jgi:hypothetical protein